MFWENFGRFLIVADIQKSIRNNQKPTKIFPKRNCKEKINTIKPPQCDLAIGLHLLQNNSAPTTTMTNNFLSLPGHYIFSKTNSAPTTTMTNNFLFLPGHKVHSIFQHWKPLTSKP